MIEITSHCESLFLGNQKNNPFYSFLVELKVNDSAYSNYGQFDKVFNDYIRIDNLEDADVVRQNIRTLSKISPSANDGETIKKKFLDKLDELVKLGLETNIKALRNIDLSAFKNGEHRVKQILSYFIKNAFESDSNIQIELLVELLTVSFSETMKNCWHHSVRNSFKTVFLNLTNPASKKLWKLLDYSEEALKLTLNLLPSTEITESQLRENIPADIEKETAIAIEMFSKEKKWRLLHADILLKYLQIKEVVIKQLEIERFLKLEDSKGVKYLSAKLSDNEQINLTLECRDDKMICLAAKRTLKTNRC